MQFRPLGRTGLRVSVVGLGTGGPSQFGQDRNASDAEIRRLVGGALDLGINFFDTSPMYGESERILGRALGGISRSSYLLATKFAYERDHQIVEPTDVIRSVEQSLVSLRTDSLDLLQFHGIKPFHYPEALERLMPVAESLRKQGKVRFLGATENYRVDGHHETLNRVVKDGQLDTVMVGYNLLGPGAEADLLPACTEKEIGAICMVAVRRSLSRPDHLRERLKDAVYRGVVDAGLLSDLNNPLDWLLSKEVVSLTDAGYKYVAANPAISTVLAGTSRLDHLKANVGAILGPPLPDYHMERLRQIFGHVREPLAN